MNAKVITEQRSVLPGIIAKTCERNALILSSSEHNLVYFLASHCNNSDYLFSIYYMLYFIFVTMTLCSGYHYLCFTAWTTKARMIKPIQGQYFVIKEARNGTHTYYSIIPYSKLFPWCFSTMNCYSSPQLSPVLDTFSYNFYVLKFKNIVIF